VDTDQTPAQKDAGNYKKGHVQIGTFDVTIEQHAGSVCRGTDADGKEWKLSDVSAEDTDVLYRRGEASVEDSVSGFEERFNSCQSFVVRNSADIDSEGLSERVTDGLREALWSGGVPAAYCRENKKIYIFADTFEKSGSADYILYHENIHAMIDSLSDYPKAMLRSISETLTSNNVRLAKMYEALGEEYNSADVDEEFFAYVISGRLLNPRKFEKLYNALGESEREFVYEIVKQIDSDNANEYRNIEAVRGVLPGRSRGDDTSTSGIDRGAARNGRDGGTDLARKGDGYGAYSDAEVSYMNDPISSQSEAAEPMTKVMGKNRFSKKRQAEFAERERQRMAARIVALASKLNLDEGQLEVVTDLSQLDGRHAKAKGFYNKRTGRITIVLPNHLSMIDAEQTLLHEAVAHYGLRKLFGERFNTFLDNVYASADEGIRRKIAEMAAKNGWDFRTATEEYLASLAEDTNFEQDLGIQKRMCAIL